MKGFSTMSGTILPLLLLFLLIFGKEDPFLLLLGLSSCLLYFRYSQPVPGKHTWNWVYNEVTTVDVKGHSFVSEPSIVDRRERVPSDKRTKSPRTFPFPVLYLHFSHPYSGHCRVQSLLVTDTPRYEVQVPTVVSLFLTPRSYGLRLRGLYGIIYTS